MPAGAWEAIFAPKESRANAGPSPGDMPIDRFIAALPLPQYLAQAANECGCWRCIDARGGMTIFNSWMVLCPVCGNKRCPHANDHDNECTGSNEPGQPGSAYPKADLSITEPKINISGERVDAANVTDWSAG